MRDGSPMSRVVRECPVVYDNAMLDPFRERFKKMLPMEFILRTDEGRYDIEAYVRFIGADLLVAISGGEKPHIGAVAVAQPRPSLRNPEATSSTASVFCFPGHKEDDLAKAAALKLSAALGANVVLTAGVHWDRLDSEGIQTVMRNAEILVDMILEKLSPDSPADFPE